MDARAVAWAGAAVMVGLALPSALAWPFDDREIFGASLWDKPLRFDLALGVHLLTLWALLQLLPPARLASASMRRTLLVCTVCAVLEALYITLQAARGRASHFKVQTALEQFLYYGAMGPGAVLIVATTFIVGWQLWRHADPATAPGLRSGAALGLMLGSVATLLVAAPLSAGLVDGLGHWVGGVHSDRSGMPVFGWSRTGGDLRVSHFFAVHLMQALPLAGWIADRAGAPRPRLWVHGAAGISVSVVAATFWQAHRRSASLGTPVNPEAVPRPLEGTTRLHGYKWRHAQAARVVHRWRRAGSGGVRVAGAVVCRGCGRAAAGPIRGASPQARLGSFVGHVRRVRRHGAPRADAGGRPRSDPGILEFVRGVQGALPRHAHRHRRGDGRQGRADWPIRADRPHAGGSHAAGGRRLHGGLASGARRSVAHPEHAHRTGERTLTLWKTDSFAVGWESSGSTPTRGFVFAESQPLHAEALSICVAAALTCHQRRPAR